MPDLTNLRQQTRTILANAKPGEAFAAIADPEHAGRAILHKIAGKIGRTRRPGALSAIPSGAVYLAQFAAHDLDLRSREDASGAPRLDLALIYGDGPRHDAFAYQVPRGPGEARRLLRVSRARPASGSPAWGAARDLPRAACPHLDALGVEMRTEVLVPNAFSDSNLLLGQVQTLWALLHNAVVSGLPQDRDDPTHGFETARRITRHIYREALINDLLGTWLLSRLRERYVKAAPDRLSREPLRAMPRAFQTGVARLGHGLVREIYEVNDRREVEGLRSLSRHTSTGRPSDMPLTEDWLVDFARFFDMSDRKAQRARELGPHVARPFALGGGVGLDAPTPDDGLVLRDLVACTRGGATTEDGAPSVRTLVERIAQADPALLDGSLAQNAGAREAKVAAWLGDLNLDPRVAQALAKDPPLTLFLMLEAEADAQGQTLGAVGSVLLAETVTGALPAPASSEDLKRARETVFRGPVPTRMAEVIEFLQRHYQFADGARLHPADLSLSPSPASTPMQPPEASMLDDQTSNSSPTGLVEVADYIELGRLVADWTRSEAARPKGRAQLVAQLDGIAKVPEAITDVKFVDSEPGILVIRLPDRDLMDQSIAKLETPLVGDRYMLPKFYDDIYHKHFGPEMTPLDIFLARIGDYTIAQCK